MDNEIMNIIPFDNEEFGTIRAIKVDGKTLFIGRDIAISLGYSNPNDAISRHCKGVVKHDTPTTSGIQNMSCIAEGDVYRLITHSKLPSAEKFESWIFDEVLPTIRQTGGYISNSDLFVNTYFDDVPEEQKGIIKGLLTSVEEKQKKINTLTAEKDLLTKQTLEWADRPLINALVRAYGYSMDGDYQKAWRDFKKELLYRYGVNLNARKTAHLNNGGSKKKGTLDFINDDELPQAVSTAVALCEEHNIDISEIIQKKAG